MLLVLPFFFIIVCGCTRTVQENNHIKYFEKIFLELKNKDFRLAYFKDPKEERERQPLPATATNRYSPRVSQRNFIMKSVLIPCL